MLITFPALYAVWEWNKFCLDHTIPDFRISLLIPPNLSLYMLDTDTNSTLVDISIYIYIIPHVHTWTLKQATGHYSSIKQSSPWAAGQWFLPVWRHGEFCKPDEQEISSTEEDHYWPLSHCPSYGPSQGRMGVEPEGHESNQWPILHSASFLFSPLF